MNQKKRKTRTPAYLREFRCIGSPCEDNCCIGWDVDFDRKSYRKYAQVKDGELEKLFRTCVRPNPDAFSDEVDFASVKLRKNKVCPFLNDEHLCKIQMRFGEGYLSNVCATYPRYTNIIDGVYEHSATVSCPEAARLILRNRDGLSFIEGEESARGPMILNYDVNTRDKSAPLRVKHLLELREFSISLLQNRKIPLWERILLMGEFYEGLRHDKAVKSKDDIRSRIEEYKKKLEKGNLKPRIASLPADPAGQLALLTEITDSLNVFTEIDSKRYIAFTREFLNGIRPDGTNSIDEVGRRLAQAYREHYEPFIKDHEYLIENYLVNFIFKDLFPASEGNNAFDAYMMLVIRYALIKQHLIGIAAYRNGLTEDTVVGFIQAFSKTVEHHKTYLENIAEHMIKKRYNTMQHMAILLKD